MNIYSFHDKPETLHGWNQPHISHEEEHRRTSWHMNGQLHREGAPAVTNEYGTCEEWWHHGNKHRADGPAYVLRHSMYGGYDMERWYHNDVLLAEILMGGGRAGPTLELSPSAALIVSMPDRAEVVKKILEQYVWLNLWFDGMSHIVGEEKLRYIIQQTGARVRTMTGQR
jgi:hypothetical protein